MQSYRKQHIWYFILLVCALVHQNINFFTYRYFGYQQFRFDLHHNSSSFNSCFIIYNIQCFWLEIELESWTNVYDTLSRISCNRVYVRTQYVWWNESSNMQPVVSKVNKVFKILFTFLSIILFHQRKQQVCALKFSNQ